jgi:hypothetical protein
MKKYIDSFPTFPIGRPPEVLQCAPHTKSNGRDATIWSPQLSQSAKTHRPCAIRISSTCCRKPTSEPGSPNYTQISALRLDRAAMSTREYAAAVLPRRFVTSDTDRNQCMNRVARSGGEFLKDNSSDPLAWNANGLQTDRRSRQVQQLRLPERKLPLLEPPGRTQDLFLAA